MSHEPDVGLEALDPAMERLLSAERARPGLTARAQGELLRGLEDALGLPPAPPAGSAGGSAPATPVDGSAAATGSSAGGAAAGTSLARVGALVVAAFVTGGLAGLAGSRSQPPALARAGVVEVRVVAAEAALRSLLASARGEAVGEVVPFQALPTPEAPATSADARTSAPRSTPSAEPATSALPRADDGRADTSLAAERRLLEIARTAVGRGKSDAALEALARHASEFPRGRLAEEREAMRVQALLAAGRQREARESSDAFRQAYPRSILLPALEEETLSRP